MPDSFLSDAQKEIEKAASRAALLELKRCYLGKEGVISSSLRKLKTLDERKRASEGKRLHLLKNTLEKSIEQKLAALESEERSSRLEEERVDVTQPGLHTPRGSTHPLTLMRREAVAIFERMGFSVITGPEVETERYNFDLLNIPEDHPARDLWDTFWIKEDEPLRRRPAVSKHKKKERLLLRTHTSPMQVRFMEQHQPPFRIVVPGKVFRYEATDASHDIEFMQLEGLMVSRAVSFADLKGMVHVFFRRLFHSDIAVRLRPSFFPFTEPSVEIDITCVHCAVSGSGKEKKRGHCPICKNERWLEVAGAGMVHPNVFLASGLNPRQVQGFAFGMGLDRIAMTRYKIPDVRLFHSNDLRFLRQFN